jgi:hypothetical protein
MSAVASPERLRHRTRGRCAIRNLTRHVHGVDRRTKVGRRLDAIVEALAADMGGLESMNETDRTLLRSAATLMLLAELLASSALSGERPVDVDGAVRLSSECRRLLDRVQRRERPQPAQRSLADILREREAAA